MSVDILGTSWDQCTSIVQYCFTSMETVRLARTESPGRPPRLSHSSWALMRSQTETSQLCQGCGQADMHSFCFVWFCFTTATCPYMFRQDPVSDKACEGRREVLSGRGQSRILQCFISTKQCEYPADDLTKFTRSRQLCMKCEQHG